MDARDNNSGSEKILSYDAKPFLVALKFLHRKFKWYFRLSQIATAFFGLSNLSMGIYYASQSGINSAEAGIGLFAGSGLLVLSVYPHLLWGEINAQSKEEIKDSGLADQIGLGEIKIPPPSRAAFWVKPMVQPPSPYLVLNYVVMHLPYLLLSSKTKKVPPRTAYLVLIPVLLFLAFICVMAVRSGYGVTVLLIAIALSGMMISMVGSMNFNHLLLLRKYLDDCWGQPPLEAKPVYSPDGLISTTREDVDRKVGLHRMLNEVSQMQGFTIGQTNEFFSVSIFFSLFSALPLFMIVLGYVSNISGNTTIEMVLTCAFFIGLSLLLTDIPRRVLRREIPSERETIRNLISKSNLAIQILNQDFGDRKLEEFVPWAFKIFVMNRPRMFGQGDELRNMISRVSFNLDWYLHPAKRLVRPVWLYMVGSAISLLVAVGSPVMYFGFFSSYAPSASVYTTLNVAAAVLGIPIAIVGTAIFFSVRIAQHNRKVKIWGEELINHLKERLAE